MDLSSLLLSGEYQWDGNPPASPEDIASLQAAFPVPLPTDYMALLRLSDGGEAELSGYPEYVRIWPALQSINLNDGYLVSHWLPGFIGFGDDGSEEMVGFDTRQGEPYPVCSVPVAPMTWELAKGKVSEFSAFINQLLPREQAAEPTAAGDGLPPSVLAAPE